MGKKTAFRVEHLFIALFFLLITFIFLSTAGYPTMEWARGGSPGFYPRFLATLLIMLNFAWIWESIKKPTLFLFPNKKKAITLIISLIILFSAPKLFYYLGFRVASFFLLILLMFSVRDWKFSNLNDLLKNVLYSAIVTGSIYIVFVYAARVRLPIGRLTGIM